MNTNVLLSSRSVKVAAERSEKNGRPTSRSAQNTARVSKRMPSSGYFAEVDPNAEVRSPMSFVETPDLRKRPGRYVSDFIWNVDWASQLDREAAVEMKRKKAKLGEVQAAATGLGLSRKLDLNNMDIDLSQQLNRQKVSSLNDPRKDNMSPTAVEIKPTQAETRRWQRGGKFSTRAVAIPMPHEEKLLVEKAKAEKAEYEKLKMELQLWTFYVALFGVTTSWFIYSKDAAISYGLGSFGSLLYLRMLHQSVDSVTGGMGGVLGQPRLLIPIALALGFNRWNQLKAEETQVVLQLLPMLLGFFTYKASVAGKQAFELLHTLSISASKGGSHQSTEQEVLDD